MRMCRLRCRKDGCGQYWVKLALGNQAELQVVPTNHIMVEIYLGLKQET